MLCWVKLPPCGRRRARRRCFADGNARLQQEHRSARGRNLWNQQQDPTAHAETVAIRRFLPEHGIEKLKGTTLYTSGESCPMCMGAIVWCGIARVVYGASIAALAAKVGQIMITDADIADKTPFADIILTGGVFAEESLKLFK